MLSKKSEIREIKIEALPKIVVTVLASLALDVTQNLNTRQNLPAKLRFLFMFYSTEEEYEMADEESLSGVDYKTYCEAEFDVYRQTFDFKLTPLNCLLMVYEYLVTTENDRHLQFPEIIKNYSRKELIAIFEMMLKAGAHLDTFKISDYEQINDSLKIRYGINFEYSSSEINSTDGDINMAILSDNKAVVLYESLGLPAEMFVDMLSPSLRLLRLADNERLFEDKIHGTKTQKDKEMMPSFFDLCMIDEESVSEDKIHLAETKKDKEIVPTLFKFHLPDKEKGLDTQTNTTETKKDKVITSTLFELFSNYSAFSINEKFRDFNFSHTPCDIESTGFVTPLDRVLDKSNEAYSPQNAEMIKRCLRLHHPRSISFMWHNKTPKSDENKGGAGAAPSAHSFKA